MNKSPISDITWDYPSKLINQSYKKGELKAIYFIILKKLFVYFSVTSSKFNQSTLPSYRLTTISISLANLHPTSNPINQQPSVILYPNTNQQLKYLLMKYSSEMTIDASIQTQPKKQQFEMETIIIKKVGKHQLMIFNNTMNQFYQAAIGINSERQFQQKMIRNKRGLDVDNQNILLRTWIQMIILRESQTTMYQIVTELIGYHSSNQQDPFSIKISSYLHFLILITAKDLFLQLLSIYNTIIIYYQMVYHITQHPSTTNPPIIKQAMKLLLGQCRYIGQLVYETYTRNTQLFWPLIFQQSLKLLNRLGELKVQLIADILKMVERCNEGREKEELEEVIKDILLKKQQAIEMDEWCKHVQSLIINYQEYIITLSYFSTISSKSLANLFCELYWECENKSTTYGAQLRQFFQIVRKNLSKYHTQILNNMHKTQGVTNIITLIQAQVELFSHYFHQLNNRSYSIQSQQFIELPIINNQLIKRIIKGQVNSIEANQLLLQLNDYLRHINILNYQYLLSCKQQNLKPKKATNGIDLSNYIQEKISQPLTKIINILQIHNQILKTIIEAIQQCKKYYCLYIHNITNNSYLISQKIYSYLEIYEKISNKINCILKNNKEVFDKQIDQNQQQALKNYFIVENIFFQKNYHQSKPFEMIAKYYSQMAINLKLNSFIASLYVSKDVYQNIKNYHSLSQDKREKVKIIGVDYYQAVERLQVKDDKVINQQKLEYAERMQHITEMIILISFIYMIYDGKCQKKVVIGKKQNKYVEYLKGYFLWKIHSNIEKYRQEDTQALDIDTLINNIFDNNQILTFDFNSSNVIEKLLQIRANDMEENFRKELRDIIQQQMNQISVFSEDQKIQYLQKKIFYLMLRQMYFHLTYDCNFFENKPDHFKNNYELYEENILQFFEQITKRNQQQFHLKKKYQLIKRSAFLQGYQIQYQEQPSTSQLQRVLNRKIVTVFNQILTLNSSQNQINLRKKPLLPSFNNQSHKNVTFPLYLLYLGREYINNKGIKLFVFTSQEYHLIDAVRHYQAKLNEIYVNSVQNYQIIQKHQQDFKMVFGETLSKEEIDLLKENQDSVVSIIKSAISQNLHKQKLNLIKKKLLLKIQKLYINLHVRHKVFESFKDKILSYEMQKAKIYHQYMDYIRGLKLDVYSHLANEDSTPYLKLITVIKFKRFKIKKKQLQKKVNEQYGKNLQRWNEGIIPDLIEYDQWISKQLVDWQNIMAKEQINKKNLFEIYSAVIKQLQRQQNKNIKVSNSIHKSCLVRKSASRIIFKKY